MNDLNAILDTGIHFIERNDIFGVMVTDLHQVSDLAVRSLRNPDTDLHIDSLSAACGHKVDFLCIILSNENIVTSALQFKKHDVLHCTVQHFAVIAQQSIFQGNIGQVILLLGFQDALALQVIAFARIDNKRLLQPSQIVIDALHRNLAMLAL